MQKVSLNFFFANLDAFYYILLSHGHLSVRNQKVLSSFVAGEKPSDFGEHIIVSVPEAVIIILLHMVMVQTRVILVDL